MVIEKIEIPEKVYEDNRKELQKLSINIYNYEKFVDKLEAFISQFDEAINGSSFRAGELLIKIEKSAKTTGKFDWEGVNIFRDMYADMKNMTREFQLQNDYRRQWILFQLVGVEKIVNLLKTLRTEYEEVAIVKAEKIVVEQKLFTMKEEIYKKISDLEDNLGKKIKMLLSEELDANTKKITNSIAFERPSVVVEPIKEEKPDEPEDEEPEDEEEPGIEEEPKSPREIMKIKFVEIVNKSRDSNVYHLIKELKIPGDFNKAFGVLHSLMGDLIIEGKLPMNYRLTRKAMMGEDNV